MFKSNSKKNKSEKGQGLVEYALILVLVSIVVVAVLMLLGPIIGNIFSSVNGSLSGLGGGAVVVVPTEPPTPCASTPAFESWKSNIESACKAKTGVGQFVQYSCNASTNTTSATCFVASKVGQTPLPYNMGSFNH